MENLFGEYLFDYDFDYNGKKGYYCISGDTRDYIAKRYADEEIDEKIFPEMIDFGKINDRLVPCSIENHVLYNAILRELELHLNDKGIVWGSHYS